MMRLVLARWRDHSKLNAVVVPSDARYTAKVCHSRKRTVNPPLTSDNDSGRETKIGSEEHLNTRIVKMSSRVRNPERRRKGRRRCSFCCGSVEDD